MLRQVDWLLEEGAAVLQLELLDDLSGGTTETGLTSDVLVVANDTRVRRGGE
jgi:hypothetical protein